MLLKLAKFNRALWIQLVLPFLPLRDVLVLASTDRFWRSFLRSEAVWQRLHSRDHPIITEGQHISCIRDQFLAVRALLNQRPPKDQEVVLECWQRLAAVQSLLEMASVTPGFPIYRPGVTPDDYAAAVASKWSFQVSFIVPAATVLAAVPSLTAATPRALSRPDCILIERKPKDSPSAQRSNSSAKVAPAGSDEKKADTPDDQASIAFALCVNPLLNLLENWQLRPFLAVTSTDAKRSPLALTPATVSASASVSSSPAAPMVSSTDIGTPLTLTPSTLPESADKIVIQTVPNAESSPSSLISTAVELSETSRNEKPTAFDAFQYDKGRLRLGMDNHIRALAAETKRDPTSVAVLTGPMAPSKAKYIVRARRRACANTTFDCRTLLAVSVQSQTYSELFLTLPFWITSTVVPIFFGRALDNDTSFVNLAVYWVFAATAPALFIGFFAFLSVTIFVAWHMCKYGPGNSVEDRALLPIRWRWVYLFFDINDGPPSMIDLVTDIYIMTTCGAILSAATVAVAVVSLPAWQPHVSVVLQWTGGFGMSVLMLMTGGWGMNHAYYAYQYRSAELVYMATRSFLGSVGVMLAWVAVYGKISFLPALVAALVALTFSLVVPLLAFRNEPREDIKWMNKKVTRAKGACLVWFLLNAIIKLSLHSPWLSWVGVFAGITVLGAAYVVEAVYEITKDSCVKVKHPTIITYATVTDVETVWSGIDLKSVPESEKATLATLRGSDLFRDTLTALHGYLTNAGVNPSELR